MPTDHVRRGRPKGSGLDDRAQLNAIVQLLAADRNLKPTTAIKRIGVTDPSTIRRLRDKLRSSLGEPVPPQRASADADPEDEPRRRKTVKGAEKPVVQPAGPPSPSLQVPNVEAVAAPSKVDAEPTTAPVVEQAASESTDLTPPDVASESVASEGVASEWLVEWIALGFRALSLSVSIQRVVAEDVLRTPQVASVLRHQVQLNNSAKALFPNGSGFGRRRKT